MANYLISTSDFNDDIVHSFNQGASSIEEVYRIVNRYFGVEKVDINIDAAIEMHGRAAILIFKKKCIITKEE
jgi:hypothetical protein